MQIIFVYFLKTIKIFLLKIKKPFDYVLTYFILYANGVEFSRFKSNGWPKINIGIGGKCTIGDSFTMNNREFSNPIGRFHACSIVVGKKGILSIGNNTGISSTAIVCHNKITIGNNVKIGGNVVIYDTDFHSLNAEHRLKSELDNLNTNTAEVSIGDNVFIGAHTTILKGITIGNNAIIGACSVVTKNAPANEIWAGNPAKFIRKIKNENK
jgi:acetyltransferase-like isoleucine patch superfamily enzyme